MAIDKTEPLYEDPILACRAILQRLAELQVARGEGSSKPYGEPNRNDERRIADARRRLLLRDLSHKSRGVPPAVLGSLVVQHMMPEVADAMGISSPQHARDPAPKGCLILVAKPNELVAARAALNLKASQSIDVDGYATWEFQRQVGARSARFVLSMIGDSGPEVALNACRTLVPHFRVATAILCGTTAGIRGKTEIGNVLCGQIIKSTMPERLEPKGALPRFRDFTVPDQRWRRLSYFLSEKGRHWNGLQEALSILDPSERPRNLKNTWEPKVEGFVTLLSRPKLIADGKLPKTRKTIDERIRGSEMEAAGFCSACESLGISWWIIKGVSDYGDPASKDGKRKDRTSRKLWQFPATAAAVVFASNFYCSLSDF